MEQCKALVITSETKQPNSLSLLTQEIATLSAKASNEYCSNCHCELS